MRELRHPAVSEVDTASASPDEYLASVTVRLGSLGPGPVLASTPAARAGAGPGFATRGFWQSGSRWIAHAGTVQEIDSRERAGSVGRSGVGGCAAGETAHGVGDLFEWVRDRARRLYGRRWILDLDGDARRPRLHGGFAFDDRGQEESEAGFWEPFAAARFTLPAFEVEADARGTRLTVTGAFGRETPGDRAIDELRRRADRSRERLLALERADAAPGPVPPATSLNEPVGPKEWRRSVARILREIESGAVRKVVLARPLDVTLAEVPDSAAILDGLRTRNPLAHTYLVQFGHDRFLVGAAPEVIGSLQGTRFRTMAVGGSTPRGADPEGDAWLGRQLLGSRKNRAEHRVVVEDIVERLAGLGVSPDPAPEPALLRLPRIQHLRTDLQATVPGGTHILSLLRALHPTAAVSGYPRERAHALLRAEERIARGWYAGPVGWLDETGGGEFAPALRSAVCRGPLLRLYAGAGIVEGSRPRAEWDETRVKLQTMLGALGVARVP